jgi:hypothetical protein
MDQAEAAALEAGWQLFLHHQGDIPFAEIVKVVHAHCARVDEKRIQAEFKKRFKQEHGGNGSAAAD